MKKEPTNQPELQDRRVSYGRTDADLKTKYDVFFFFFLNSSGFPFIFKSLHTILPHCKYEFAAKNSLL